MSNHKSRLSPRVGWHVTAWTIRYTCKCKTCAFRACNDFFNPSTSTPDHQWPLHWPTASVFAIDMNGLLTHSNLSFESFDSAPPRPPSNMSFVTNTSSNTVHVQGIGTLTGRIIYAFGESALRGIENLAIRRRLRKVISVFPHEDESVIKDIDMVYDHTLELSRYLVDLIRIKRCWCMSINTDLDSIEHKSESKHWESYLSRSQRVKLAISYNVWRSGLLLKLPSSLPKS